MTQRKSLDEYSSITLFLENNKEFILEDEVITCVLCFRKYAFNPARGIYNIKKHKNSQKHKDLLEVSVKNNLVMQVHSEDALLEHHIDLVNMMTQMNYPLADLDAAPFKKFAEKNIKFPLFSSSFYRKSILPKLYYKKLEILRTLLTNKPFYIILDSTTDSTSRSILCIIIGVCAKNNEGNSYLLGTVDMLESKAHNYTAEVIKILCNFFGNNMDFNLFKLLVTDQAPVMLALGRQLKESFRELKHVSCLAHLCHNIAEKVRSRAVNADKIISILKKLLIKNKTNKEILYTITGLRPYKFPILIRWGAWIEFACWLYENYMAIGDFIKEMDGINSTNNFELYNTAEFEREMRFCKSFEWIPVYIKKYEANNLSTESQIQYLREIIQKTEASFLQEYITKSLSKNPDINFFMEYNELRSRSAEKIYAYSPLTSVDVERAFSLYRNLFSEQRKSMKIESLNQHLFLYFNKKL